VSPWRTAEDLTFGGGSAMAAVVRALHLDQHLVGRRARFKRTMKPVLKYLSVLYFKSNHTNPTVNPQFRPPEGAQLKRP